VNTNDNVKTWMITLKSQVLTGGLLAVVMIIVWFSLPMAEFWVLKQYMKWQQQSENRISQDVNILALDEASIEFLENRFKASVMTDAFYNRLFKDLNGLSIPNVVLNLAPIYTANTRWKRWETGRIKVSQAFSPNKLLILDSSFGDPRIGIHGNDKPLGSESPVDQLLFPVVYDPIQYIESDALQGKLYNYPSIAISGILQRHNALAKDQKAKWKLDSNEEWERTEKRIEIFTSPLKNSMSQTIQMDAKNRVLLRWSKQQDYFFENLFSTRPLIPVKDLYTEFDPKLVAQLKNKTVVLTSITSDGLLTQPTVLSSQHLQADVIATAMENFEQGQSIAPAPKSYVFLLTLLMLSLGLLPRLKMRKSILPFIIVATSVSCYLLWATFSPYLINVYYPFATPVAIALMGHMIGLYYWRIVEEKNLRNLELNMTQLVSQSVLSEIKSKTTRLSAGGKRTNITSMFVDVRNFTQLSENMSPKEMTEILNDWYTEIEAIANEYRGTVDKFLGDGALVMFGAPIESTHHADMAMRAARHMIEKSEAIGRKHKEERNIDFSIGVSMNSGFAFVGFVGPKNKLEYTAIGDVVNTAARLQDQTKVLGCKIIFSESTLHHCQNVNFDSPIIDMGSVKVRGKEQSISVYTFEDMLQESDVEPTTEMPIIELDAIREPLEEKPSLFETIQTNLMPKNPAAQQSPKPSLSNFVKPNPFEKQVQKALSTPSPLRKKQGALPLKPTESENPKDDIS